MTAREHAKLRDTCSSGSRLNTSRCHAIAHAIIGARRSSLALRLIDDLDLLRRSDLVLGISSLVLG